MDANKKRKGDSSSSSSEEEDMDIEMLQGETVKIDFELFNPEEKDFMALKTMLKNYLDGAALDGTALVEIILNQGGQGVGSVIKVPLIDDEDEEEDEGDLQYSDPFGLLAVVNIMQHKNQAFAQQVRDFCMSKVTTSPTKLKAFFDGEYGSLGLLINERMMNVPAEVAPSMHQMLFDEIAKSKGLECDHYLLLSSFYQQANKGTKKLKQEQSYFNAEEIEYKKHSIYSSMYQRVTKDHDQRPTLDNTVVEHRQILIVPKSEIKSIVSGMTKMFAS